MYGISIIAYLTVVGKCYIHAQELGIIFFILGASSFKRIKFRGVCVGQPASLCMVDRFAYVRSEYIVGRILNKMARNE
jgi:hypothetical protein